MLFNVFGYQFHIFEIPLLIFLMGYFIIHFASRKGGIVKEIYENKKYFHLFLIGFCLLFISKIISFWPAMVKNLVISDLLKWIEILTFAILIFNFKYFKYIYWILALITLSPVLISLCSTIINLNFFSGYRVFSGYPAVFTISLLLPFSKKYLLIDFLYIFLLTTNILSVTRGAWVALFVILSYYISINFKDNKKYILKIIGVTLITILILINIPAVQDNILRRTLNPLLVTNSTSNFTRSGMIFICIEAFRENPITGIGSGNFAPYVMKNPYIHMGKNFEIPENMAPHSIFLQLLAENGVLGFIAMIIILLALVNVLFRKKIFLEYIKSKEYILGLRMFFLSFVIHLTFGFVAGSGRLIFGMLMGLILSLLKLNHDDNPIKI